MVNIISDENKISVNVCTNGNSKNIEASLNSVEYYSRLAQDWAISPVKVQNEDFSSKFYATQSAQFLEKVSEEKEYALFLINKAQEDAILKLSNQEAVSLSVLTEEGIAQTEAAKQQANLAKQYADSIDFDIERINTSKMYATGSVSEDMQGFEQLKSMRNSSFDPSKFTVVGSPIITDDGTVSGLSAGNHLIIPSFDISKPFEFSGVFTTGQNVRVSQAVFGSVVSSNNFLLGIHLDAYPIIYYPPVSGDNFLKIRKTVSPSTKYAYKLSFDGEQLTFNLTDGNSYNETVRTTNLSTAKLGLLATLYIGRNTSGVYAMQPDATIDLPKFCFKREGKEVFSGNKTGIDTIKPDNYTVVGTPVISEDGVVSGFGSGNYIKMPSFDSTKPWEIEIPFKTGNTISAQMLLSLKGTTGDGADYLVIKGIKSLSLRLFSISVTIEHPVILAVNTEYVAKIGWSGGEYYLSVGDVVQSAESSTAVEASDVRLGYDLNARWYFMGSIDLNGFKNRVNGQLVYQPCLKIPYTLSKTGSKIVDEVFRDRVIDLYEQQGQAGYYTIDEENQNFTLPMGEVYGMIESCMRQNHSNDNKPYIAEAYHNASSWYRIYSDGWCEQGGRVENTTNITYLKPFADTNYMICITPVSNVSVLLSTYSERGCTFAEAPSLVFWMTCGYLA